MGKQIWISPNNNGWKAHEPGAKRAIGNFETQQEAFQKGISVAKNQGGEVFLQGRNGQIRERNTYPRSRDPFPPRG